MKKRICLILYGMLLLGVLLGVENLFGSQVDWLGQHTAFPETFRQNFYETGRLIPEILFGLGGGQNAFHFVYYGLCSPLIWLSYALPFVDMTVYIISMSILLYLAGGLLVYRFLRHHFDDTKAFFAALLFLTLPPVTYQFHHHIMFVWYLPFFVLALMGLDSYFEKQKTGWFVISAFCMILTNYYFSVGALIFLFAYAVYWMLKKGRLDWKIIILFDIPVLLSGFVLLPTAYTLMANGRGGSESEQMINLLVPSLEETFYSPYSMGLTAIMIVVVIGNLICKRRKREEVFLNLFATFVLLCPAFMYALNGMLYVRGKVLISCAVLFLYLLCKFWEHMEQGDIPLKKTVLWSGLMVILLMVLRKDNWQVGLILLLELGLLTAFGKYKKAWYLCPVLCALTITCLVHTSETYVTVADYQKLYSKEAAELFEETGEGNYRTQLLYREKDTANRIYGGNYFGTAVYSSTANVWYQKFYESELGNNIRYRNCFIMAGTKSELFYDFMGTRYIISDKDPGIYYEPVAKGEHLTLYENPTACPLVYQSRQEDTLEQYQKAFIKRDVKDQYVFRQKEKETYTISLDESYRNKLVYLSFELVNEGAYENKRDVSITINGVKNKLTKKNALYYNGNTCFQYVISMEDLTELHVEITKGAYQIQNLKLYTAEKIVTGYEEAENLCIDQKKGEISCKVDSTEGEYLLTTIPYDAGWSATIDGKKTETMVVNQAFVGVKLSEGAHQVVLTYHTPLLKEGALVSLMGVVLFLALALQKVLRKYRELLLYGVFGVLTTIVSLTVYFACTHLFLNAEHGLELQAANIISWFVSVLFAYVTNRTFVFRSKGRIKKELLSFYLSRLGTLGIDMLLMFVLVTVSGMQDGLAKVIVQIVVVIANYVLGKWLVFKEEVE